MCRRWTLRNVNNDELGMIDFNHIPQIRPILMYIMRVYFVISCSRWPVGRNHGKEIYSHETGINYNPKV